MSRFLVASGLALVLIVSFALPTWAGDPVETGLTYLAEQQQPDGGFTNGFSEGSDLGTTCDVVLAIAAAGEDPSAWRSSDGKSPLDYLAAQVASDAVGSVGLKAKVVLALLTAGLDPSDFVGHNLVGELEAAYDATTGSYGSSLFDQALVILALSNADRTVPDGAVQYLLDNRTERGGWSFTGDTTPESTDTNTTALAIQALVATGHESEVADALTYLREVQNEDGGFPYQKPSDYGTDTDANSTAYVLQALLAAGESLDDWAPAGTNPLEALQALYDAESGGFLWQAAVPGPNVLATAQAIPALKGYTFVSLPQVEAAEPPEVVPAETLLPASGGATPLPLAVGLAGLLMVAAGVALRRSGRR